MMAKFINETATLAETPGQGEGKTEAAQQHHSEDLRIEPNQWVGGRDSEKRTCTKPTLSLSERTAVTAHETAVPRGTLLHAIHFAKSLAHCLQGPEKGGRTPSTNAGQLGTS